MHNAAQQNNAPAVTLLPAADFALERAPAASFIGDIREGWFRERNALWNLMRWMQYQGFSLGRVFDGEQWESVDSLEQALTVCSSVDESVLQYSCPSKSNLTLYTMFGEGREGVVTDHSCRDLQFVAAVNSFMYVVQDNEPMLGVMETSEDGSLAVQYSLLAQAYDMELVK